MPNTAMLFPGQGSQTPHMRDTVARERPELLEQVIALTAAPFDDVPRRLAKRTLRDVELVHA